MRHERLARARRIFALRAFAVRALRAERLARAQFLAAAERDGAVAATWPSEPPAACSPARGCWSPSSVAEVASLAPVESVALASLSVALVASVAPVLSVA